MLINKVNPSFKSNFTIKPLQEIFGKETGKRIADGYKEKAKKIAQGQRNITASYEDGTQEIIKKDRQDRIFYMRTGDDATVIVQNGNNNINYASVSKDGQVLAKRYNDGGVIDYTDDNTRYYRKGKKLVYDENKGINELFDTEKRKAGLDVVA